jgi:hypothetical protein
LQYDLKRVQEGMLRKMIEAGETGVAWSRLLPSCGGARYGKWANALRQLELAGKARVELGSRGSGWPPPRIERWFALVDDPKLDHAIEDGLSERVPGPVSPMLARWRAMREAAKKRE